MDEIDRARVLRQRHREDEAERVLLGYLARHPEDGDGHLELALTRLAQGGKGAGGSALEAAEAALGLGVDVARAQGVRSLALGQLGRHEDAVAAADAGIADEPENLLCWLAKAEAQGGLRRWAEAERAAREAVRLDPDDRWAAGLLANALRAQGRLDEAGESIAAALQRDPEDEMAQANAGWAALHGGRPAEAERHFLEALRLSPQFEGARQGLRESYKARSFSYRLFLRWAFFMERFSGRMQWAIVIGLFLAFRFGRELAGAVHPALAVVVGLAYVVLVFGSFLASGLGHLLLLKDPRARLSLVAWERWDGALVGGGFVAGLCLVLAGALGGGALLGLAVVGGGLVLGAIPGSMVFGNGSTVGRWVFGGLACFVVASGVAGGVALMVGGGDEVLLGLLVGPAVLAALGSTWLSMVPALRR